MLCAGGVPRLPGLMGPGRAPIKGTVDYPGLRSNVCASISRRKIKCEIDLSPGTGPVELREAHHIRQLVLRIG